MNSEASKETNESVDTARRKHGKLDKRMFWKSGRFGFGVIGVITAIFLFVSFPNAKQLETMDTISVCNLSIYLSISIDYVNTAYLIYDHSQYLTNEKRMEHERQMQFAQKQKEQQSQ
jgi:hypothetical protein